MTRSTRNRTETTVVTEPDQPLNDARQPKGRTFAFGKDTGTRAQTDMTSNTARMITQRELALLPHSQSDFKATGSRSLKPLSWVAAALFMSTLSACGGEGAGDVLDELNPFDPTILEPFVGTYDITGSWNGTPNDEALMVIREPESNAESDVVIYDFSNDLGNCYQVFRPGEAKKEPTGDRIFLDDIVQFDDAVLSLSGTTLIIEYFDSFDGDADGNTTEQITYQAPAVGMLEQDISPLCR